MLGTTVLLARFWRDASALLTNCSLNVALFLGVRCGRRTEKYLAGIGRLPGACYWEHFAVSVSGNMSNGEQQRSKSGWPVLIGLTLAGLTIMMAFALAKLKSHYSSPPALPVYGPIADFTLTNQDGRAVSLADLRGKVWVADIIFTRCPGPCLGMTKQMQAIQDALPPDSPTKLVTLTTDADYDTPPVLRIYAKRFDADPRRWMFLTGTKPDIAKLARDSLKLSAVAKRPEERDSPEDLFIHSTIFVIVDKQGQLRGVFETTGEGIDPQQVKAQILAAVSQLERES
jgi:protein SCO1/2